MHSAARRARATIVLTTWIVALAAWPSAASADIVLGSPKIDGTTSTSSPPGGVLPASVTGTVSSPSTWEATRWTIGPETGCYNHTGFTSGTHTVNFQSSNKNTVTAPGVPGGGYAVEYTPYPTDNCSGTAGGAAISLSNALSVTEPAANPNLQERCGINLMLVLDESGSIASTTGATAAVRNATKAFLGALSGTGSQVSIIDFSTNAGRPIGYTVVTPESITGTFNPYIDNTNGDGYNPNGWTNWEAAFKKVGEANGQGTLADLVVFMTDGDPTAMNTSSGTQTGLTEGDVEAMRRAEQEANKVKLQKSHVFALGVGAAVNNARSANRLKAVSGFEEYPGNPFGESDFTLEKDFAKLAAALRQIVLELCQSSVTVTKKVDEGDGNFKPDSGWKFTGSVSTSQGGYSWVQPPPAGGTGSRSAYTNDAGTVTFQWDTTSASATSTLRLSEELQDGYTYVDTKCNITRITESGGEVRRRGLTITTPVGDVTVGPNQYANCTVRNRIRPGTIEIEKNATPESSQAFAFTGSAGIGDFKLVDDQKDESVSRIFAPLAPGTYTVSEMVPEDWELTGITCTPATAAVITGAQVRITLTANGSVVCTYNDTRIDPPVPPEPPEPQPPEPPVPVPPVPVPPEPPAPPPSTELEVVKTSPRIARVGGRLPFRLTVTNTGSVAATGVNLADVPPASVALTALKASRRARVGKGWALWRIGTLAPGASLTIRGSVRVQAGSPGLKRNWAFAAAVNARLVQDRADTRILRQRKAPPVTG